MYSVACNPSSGICNLDVSLTCWRVWNLESQVWNLECGTQASCPGTHPSWRGCPGTPAHFRREFARNPGAQVQGQQDQNPHSAEDAVGGKKNCVLVSFFLVTLFCSFF